MQSFCRSLQKPIKCGDLQIVLQYALGEGQQGSVFAGLDKNDPNKQFAVKKLSIKNIYQRENIQKEIEIHKSLVHPNIIKYYGHIVQDSTLYIVMEMGECTLQKHLQTMEGGKCDQKTLFKILHDLTQGLKLIHQKRFTHRDIKTQNVVIRDGKYKITDFGISANEGLTQTFLGTPIYLAPQILRNRFENIPYNNKVDIWALGILAFQAYFGFNPFYQQNEILRYSKQYDIIEQNIKHICQKQFDIGRVLQRMQYKGDIYEAIDVREKYDRSSKKLDEFFKKTLQIDPDKRFDIEAVESLLKKQQPKEAITADIVLPADINFLNNTKLLLMQIFKKQSIAEALSVMEWLIFDRTDKLYTGYSFIEYQKLVEMNQFKKLSNRDRTIRIRQSLDHLYQTLYQQVKKGNQKIRECLFRLLVCKAFDKIMENIEQFTMIFEEVFKGQTDFSCFDEASRSCTLKVLNQISIYVENNYFS